MSVDNLQRCVQCGRSLAMPRPSVFSPPTEFTDTAQLSWEDSADIQPDEYNCQVSPSGFPIHMSNLSPVWYINVKQKYFGDLCYKLSINVSTCNINMSILASIHINMYLVVHECSSF